jgi:hypothetical protein
MNNVYLKRLSPGVTALAALILLLNGCTGETDGTDVPVAPTETATVAQTPAQPTNPAPAYQPVTIAEIGLNFEVPAGWDQLESGWTWAPPGQGAPRPIVAMTWADLEPPQESEAALLPGPSQITESEPVDLSWASGRRFTLEVYAAGQEGEGERAPVVSREIHVLLVLNLEEVRRAIDFYAAAGTSEQLADLQPILQNMLESSALN